MSKITDWLSGLLGEWSWKLTAKKLTQRAAQLLASYLAAKGAAAWGLNLDPDLLAAVLFLKLEALIDYLKHRKAQTAGVRG